MLSFERDWHKLRAKICLYRQSVTKYLAKVRKSSKLDDQKTFISAFPKLLTTIAKNIF